MTTIIQFEGFSYHRNCTRKDTVYYRCTKFISEHCKARLIVLNDVITKKGVHSCEQKQSKIMLIPKSEISHELFIENFINEKAPKVNLYPNRTRSIKSC